MRNSAKAISKNRKDRVIRAAYALFIEKSIEAVSMQMIAAKSGVGIASLYRYYLTRTELVIEVGAAQWRDIWQKIVEARPEEEFSRHPASEQFEFLLDAFIRMDGEQKDFLKFNANFTSYIRREQVPKEQLKPYLDAVQPLENRLHQMYELAGEDHSMRVDIPEDDMFNCTVHTLIAAIAKYADMAWSRKCGSGAYLPMLKEMMMFYFTRQPDGKCAKTGSSPAQKD